MAKGQAWTRSELLLAINLYCKIPFGKIDMKTPEVIQLAKKLNRTPGSISYKLANFASIDPSLPRKGASNVSKLDIEVWQEFFNNWENIFGCYTNVSSLLFHNRSVLVYKILSNIQSICHWIFYDKKAESLTLIQVIN